MAVVPTPRGWVGEGVEITRVPLTGAMTSGQRITERTLIVKETKSQEEK